VLTGTRHLKSTLLLLEHRGLGRHRFGIGMRRSLRVNSIYLFNKDTTTDKKELRRVEVNKESEPIMEIKTVTL
jgi:hypothetical protein